MTFVRRHRRIISQIGGILLIATTVLNSVSVRVTALVNSAGVTCELVGVVLLVILLLAHSERGPSVVLQHTNLVSSTGYVVPQRKANVSPRIGDSWLKRIPLHAYSP